MAEQTRYLSEKMDDTAGDLRASIVALIPRLRRYGYALTGSQDDGDEVVQAALERALTKQEQWRPGTRLDSWLFRIAHNVWIDELRRRKRRNAVDPDAVEHELVGEDARRVNDARVMLAQTRAAMAELSPDFRAVLTTVAIEGMSYREASEILGVPIGTVMSRLARARKAIAERLGETGDGGG